MISKSTITVFIFSRLLAATAAIVLPAFAGDLSSDVRKGVNSPDTNTGNYFELGMSALVYTSPYYGIPEGKKPGQTLLGASLDINLHFEYKGFFMEGFSQSLEQFTLGYNFANNENWSLDVVMLEQHPEISAHESKDLKGLKTREGDYMAGLRATGYWDDYIVQLHVLSDISEVHYGQVYSAKIARHWQRKNWNFHAILGSSYRTQDIADYYLSIQPEDVTEKFPEFHAQAGFIHIVEVGATYPLNQKWVFRSLIRHIELDHQWLGSPLITADHSDVFINSISYVF